MLSELTYNNQSTANNKDTSEVGNPRAVKIRSIVISAALGIEAAPILANVAVRLEKYIYLFLGLGQEFLKKRHIHEDITSQ